MKKFLIFSPPYDEIRGGAIALHKLCHLINELGGEACLFPIFDNLEINQLNYHRDVFKILRRHVRWLTKPYRTNPALNTPVVSRLSSLPSFPDDWIVVYPEVTFGNPLNATHVVRWLLHNPYAVKKKAYFVPGELQFKIHSYIDFQPFPLTEVSQQELLVVHFPTNYYNTADTSERRSGTAICLRKGRHRVLQHELKDAILIDGLPHKKVAEIFKRVERFISYDAYTAYSRFAALCGCDSIVVPSEGVSIDEWRADPKERYGIAYGEEQIDWARSTRYLLEERFRQFEIESRQNVEAFLRECNTHFG